jgi:hypothetical protein
LAWDRIAGAWTETLKGKISSGIMVFEEVECPMEVFFRWLCGLQPSETIVGDAPSEIFRNNLRRWPSVVSIVLHNFFN